MVTDASTSRTVLVIGLIGIAMHKTWILHVSNCWEFEENHPVLSILITSH